MALYRAIGLRQIGRQGQGGPHVFEKFAGNPRNFKGQELATSGGGEKQKAEESQNDTKQERPPREAQSVIGMFSRWNWLF
jgi:hypothetical protein